MRLRDIGMLWVVGGFALGLGGAALWIGSVRAWEHHVSHAYDTGLALYDTLRNGAPLPAGLTLEALSAADALLADNGAFARLPGAPHPAYVTNVSIRADLPGTPSGPALVLAIVSDDLRYPVSELAPESAPGAAAKLGQVTQLMARYCSEPMLFASPGDGRWLRIGGAPVWGCLAAPADYRLMTALATVILLAALLSHVARISGGFGEFAEALRARHRRGGPESYSADGPAELREIVAAVNAYLESERAQLEKRAVVLSGVSHDLGTPATRLRLRAALIPEPELRERLVADIDRMTGMIESVLTYTRSELSVEEPRVLSLSSLVEALVADYQDMGKPVSLREAEPVVVRGGRSLFMSRAGESALPEARQVLVIARPISLQRALSNLIDNALKYGRRAELELRADAARAVITVEDEGGGLDPEEIEALAGPFRRGANAASVEGFGMGLTIVATVAEGHGGRLSFERGARGLRAKLEIARQ